MNVNPIGPLSPEEWQQAINAPYGGAGAILRKHDPAWGLGDPDTAPKRWKVKFTREMIESAFFEIVATCHDEAVALADKVPDRDLTWESDYETSGPFVASCEEVKL